MTARMACVAILYVSGMLLILSIVLALQGCASVPRPLQFQPMAGQHLIFRKGFKGPVGQRCAEWKRPAWYKAPECTRIETISFDLSDADVRLALNKGDFICKVGDGYMAICPDQPGLCLYHWARENWFSSKKPVLDQFISQDQDQLLENAGANCLPFKDRAHLR